MSLQLAVESTSGLYSVAIGPVGTGTVGIGAGDGTVAHQASRRDEPGFAGLGGLVDRALAELGGAVADVSRLAVDIGPGNLSSVRAAAAYVNGLAFSLGLEIFCVSSLELLATQYSQQGSLPVLCMRKASGGNAYLGLYRGAEPVWLAFGQLGPTVVALCGSLPELAVAGGPADTVAKVLPETHVADTGLAHPDIDVLYRLAVNPAGPRGTVVDMAHPLNEGSPEFHEQARQ